MFRNRSRVIALTLTIAATVPLTTLSATSQSPGVTLPTGGLKPATDLSGTGTSQAPPKQSVVQDNLNLPPVQKDVLKPGASLGGPGSNQILEPPTNDINPVQEANQNINTGKDALNQSITTDAEQVGHKWTWTNRADGTVHEMEYLGEGQNGERIVRDNTTGNFLVGGTPTRQERLIKEQERAAGVLNNVDPAEQANAQREAGDALNAPDPAETGKAQEEAASGLGEEPGSGSGSSSGSSSGSAQSPQEEAAEGIGGEPEGGSGSGSKASGGGSEGIFQDPTKGGSGPGVQQAVEEAGGNIKNRNVNVNEVTQGVNPAGDSVNVNQAVNPTGPVGNLTGNKLQGTDLGPTDFAPNALKNTNASSFGGFEGGVSPFSAASGSQALPGIGEANTGVVRSLQSGTKGGAASLPVEEEVTGAGVIRAGKAGPGSAALPELEAEAGAPRVRVNTAVPEIPNETPINVPRR